MRTYQFATADVFTDRQFGGNPLAVVLDARGLSSDEMLAITREFNYSETTFVLPAERGGACRVRIFTPGGEVPFAGHPTVGTAHVLVALGRVRAEGAEPTVVLEENVGDVPVRVRRHEGAAEPSFAQLSVAQLPEERDAPDVDALAALLNLDASDFVGGDWAPRAASCGLPFVIAPLRTRDAVSRARVNVDALERALPAGSWTREIMVVAMAGERADARARVFVPMLNVPEDPATGSANAALAGYLAKRTPRLDGTLRWVVEQGVEMGRPSRLELEADKRAGEITGVRVGGASVLVSTGEMRLH
ncbi:phenazine biosynthesis protein PhzF family [Gemmatirosa kalamazoonensis]|uniref:Phenazine biosynthesis protein PhzF family n=1 Tax=Gemmatirosa kalamazoonensis TaxID=861299 RepID=W0RGY4_9BACT|nr:PhzF family phenazine biosynthesis protein [Gemmatirosa kalamazoonensis]AHG89595.1 phenazine biosynthesis protein PhzF family [Gemmatirosa kalamazoonensis]